MAGTFGISRGTVTRIAEIDAALPNAWIDSLSSTDFEAETTHQDLQTGWWVTPSQSSPGYARFEACFFSVLAESRLAYIIASPSFPDGTWHRIRVVGSKGKLRIVDPEISIADVTSWRLWIWGGRPISTLDWDPGEWRWPAVRKSELLCLF